MAGNVIMASTLIILVVCLVVMHREDKKEARFLKSEEYKNLNDNKGNVFVLENPQSLGRGVYLIEGTHSNDIEKEVDRYNNASLPFDYKIVSVIKTNNVTKTKKVFDKRFKVNKINKLESKSCFYKIDRENLMEFVTLISK